jgi:hypothetical protein
VWQNRQKYAQKHPFEGFSKGKTGKFCLQMSKMTLLSQKMPFLIVNFLKRRFDRRVNFGARGSASERIFKIVFLDIKGKLCYYIIYIWENSAQNRPIGGVCLTLSVSLHSVKYPLRVRAHRRIPNAQALANARTEQTKTITGKKVVNSCRRKRA